MLLTIDAGNTNIAIGLIDGEEVLGTFRLMTKTPRTSDEYVTFFDDFLERSNVQKEEIEDILFSSVVPKINATISLALEKLLDKKPIMINHELSGDIKIEIDNPREIGADLIVDMAAAYEQYHRSCMVLDFGTATTFTYVDHDGVLRYAVICTGVNTMSSALTGNAALLPEIEMVKPKSILAGNTIDAMQAGLVYGYIGLVEKIVSELKKELNDSDCVVVATGGTGEAISSMTEAIDVYDPDLAYKGMQAIYRTLKKS